MTIIDIHAHVFPDAIALKASQSISEFYSIPMYADGRVDTLLKLYERDGVTRALIHSAATSPAQVRHINDFIAGTVKRHDMLSGFMTLHPGLDNPEDEVERALSMGLTGVKLHPDIQGFSVDDRAAYPMYDAFAGRVPLLVHAGDNRHFLSEPGRIQRVLADFPRLRVLLAHLGGWSQWQEAARLFAGREHVKVDCSSSLYALPADEARRIIRAYGAENVLFGSDYPMWSPGGEVERLLALGLTSRENELILGENAESWLGLSGSSSPRGSRTKGSCA